MSKFSLTNLFGITIRESANDGSDFTNPDADYRRLFLGEDGQLHVKDSAGAVTDIGTAGTLTGTSYRRSAGSYTTTSTTFVDVDGTNLALTITTGAHRVLVGLAALATASSNALISTDVLIDGASMTGGNGTSAASSISGANVNISFVVLSTAQSAGSHTFKLQWATGAGTATMYGNNVGTVPGAYFWVAEQPF